MTKTIHRKTTDKEANAMASNDLEVLDPAAPVEQGMESASGTEIDRRHFFAAAMAVAGVAAGATLLSGKSAEAQQPSPNGYAQVDVMNFLLNLKYLKATLYSFITQGADLPGSSYVTVGTGVMLNQPAKITFTGTPTGTTAQLMTDIFNEMYYDELNQLIALRAQQGVAVAPRPTMNLIGTGPSGSPSGTATTTTLTQAQAIALLRLLEDVSTTAFAGATTYLTGTNLTLAAQALASDAEHASILRLLSIQNGVQYQGTQYASVATSNTAQSAVTFSGATTTGSNIIYATLGANIPAAGSILTGIGIPQGAGAVIKNVVSSPNTITFTATPDKTAILKNVSSVASLLPGQPITGTYIPAGSYIAPGGVGTNTVTIAPAVTTGAATVAPTGYVTLNSTVITGVSSTSGLITNTIITGTYIPANTTISAFSSSAATITLSAAATASSQVTVTGTVVSGSAKIQNLSTTTGLVVGQIISGAGIPTGTTIQSIDSLTQLTMSAPATGSSAATIPFQGILTSGNATISLVPSTTGLAVGQLLGGPGIPINTTIKSLTATSVTMSANASASSTVTPSALTTAGSNVLSTVSSVAGLIVGQTITGTYIPASTTITAIGTNTVTMSASATTTSVGGETVTSPTQITVYAGGENLTSPTTEAFSAPTTDTYTVGIAQITLAGPATVTGVNTFYIALTDNEDVQPADPGSAATSAAGPSAIAGTSPTAYQGFFNTAGGGTTGSTSTPPGFAFARTFQQVLAILYGYNSTNSIFATQNYEGGFFPVGVTGPINSVT